jgi:AraC-like DNA-binding protein
MELQFKATGDDSFLNAMAKSLGSKVEGNTVWLPKHLGSGFIKGYVIGPQMRMMIRQYEVKEPLNLKILTTQSPNDVVMIAFHNVFSVELTDRAALPSVQIRSSGFDTTVFVPAQTKMNSIIISVSVDYLKTLLTPKKEHWLLQTIISDGHPFIFEEIVSPEIQDVAARIVTEKVVDGLERFFLKVKAEELIYLLLVELLKREDTVVQSLNVADVKTIYKVKDKILSSLDTPPNLAALAAFACISESKLKRLFKQIFGNSIYNYYQNFRMKEAAYLLKEGKLSVSEVGYSLGFSNLSHFSRVFEEHIGMKPKKYSSK